MNRPDYKQIFNTALENNVDNLKWKEGDFIGIKTVSNTKVGNIGQDFIEGICECFDIQCTFPLNTKKLRAKQSPWDIEINGVKFELKTATEDVSGCFQFNHLRYHRPYDAVLCLGIAPNDIFFGLWSKADIATGKGGKLVSMEKGANASYKLTKKPKDLMPIDDFEEKMHEFTKNFNLQ